MVGRTRSMEMRMDGEFVIDIYKKPPTLSSMNSYNEDGWLIDGVGFAREGSALRASTKRNPRNLPCPTCKRENVLTPADKARGYQCDSCADAAEGCY